MELVIYPNDILRTKCEDLTESPSKELLDEMWRIVKEKKGIGLAAPQVGEKLNLFILNTETDKIVFVNPKITYYSAVECSMTEGCLSLPGEQIEIIRPELIKIKFLDKFMKKREAIFGGINARCIQHEYDHLQGILILDHYSE